MKEETAINRIRNEYIYACKHFEPFSSKCQGYAVILQELNDLWSDIKSGAEPYILKNGATKVATMALRFLIDSCYLDNSNDKA